MPTYTYMTIFCPEGGDWGTTKVCRRGICKLMDVGADRNEERGSLEERLAQHMTDVHQFEWNRATAACKLATVEIVDHHVKSRSRSRTCSPRGRRRPSATSGPPSGALR
jgi:hypothetical protein